MAANEVRIQEAYYQGQYDYIATMKPEVQQNLQVYFSNGWISALDKMQVEASSSLRLESNIPTPAELVIIPNPEIQAIINDKSPIREVDGPETATVLGGEATISTTLSSTEEPSRI